MINTAKKIICLMLLGAVGPLLLWVDAHFNVCARTGLQHQQCNQAVATALVLETTLLLTCHPVGRVFLGGGGGGGGGMLQASLPAVAQVLPAQFQITLTTTVMSIWWNMLLLSSLMVINMSIGILKCLSFAVSVVLLAPALTCLYVGGSLWCLASW